MTGEVQSSSEKYEGNPVGEIEQNEAGGEQLEKKLVNPEKKTFNLDKGQKDINACTCFSISLVYSADWSKSARS